MSADKTARWLDLVAFLLHRRYPVTREQIFDSVAGYRPSGPVPLSQLGEGTGERVGPGAKAGPDAESARRKFERDKDELRALGIEIVSVDIKDAEGDEPAS